VEKPLAGMHVGEGESQMFIYKTFSTFTDLLQARECSIPQWVACLGSKAQTWTLLPSMTSRVAAFVRNGPVARN
jgi:hypothetical protein